MAKRDDIVTALRADREFWLDLAASVGPERYAEPGPMGKWSFADLAGHLAGWRNRAIGRLEAFARGKPAPPPPWPEALDDDDLINDWIHAQHAGRSPDQLVDDYIASYQRLIDVVDTVPESAIENPGPDPWFGNPAAWDFTGHLHEEHVPSVFAWLDEKSRRAKAD